VTKEQAKIPEYEKAKVAARIEAIKYFNLALKLRGTEKDPPPTDEVNVIRYFLTYLNYDAGNSLDASGKIDFTATADPQASAASQLLLNATRNTYLSFETRWNITNAGFRKVITVATRKAAGGPPGAEPVNLKVVLAP
jgi:hypothetical protein